MNDITSLMVVCFLSLIICLCIGGVIFASLQDKEPNPVLVSTIQFGIGGLLGILVPKQGVQNGAKWLINKRPH